jgi:hypothetical protein
MSKRIDSEENFTDDIKVCDFPPDSKSKELKLLTKDPAYICGDCGRSATSQDSLCKPEKMYSTW